MLRSAVILDILLDSQDLSGLARLASSAEAESSNAFTPVVFAASSAVFSHSVSSDQFYVSPRITRPQ